MTNNPQRAVAMTKAAVFAVACTLLRGTRSGAFSPGSNLAAGPLTPAADDSGALFTLVHRTGTPVATRRPRRPHLRTTTTTTETEIETELRAVVTKRQTAVFDGAEFVSLASFLLDEGPTRRVRVEVDDGGGDEGGDKRHEYLPLQDAIASMPPMRAGFLTFVTGTTQDGDGGAGGGGESSKSGSSRRIIGVEIDVGDEDGIEEEGVIRLGDGVAVYADSVAELPDGVSDADAISTAAAALCGVHCGMPRTNGPGKAVVLGGGDYACFTAKALAELGAEVTLVTTRPMGLKDTPLNPLKDSNVTCMGPAVGKDDVGFSEALGKFHSVVDTIGDEAGLGQVTMLHEGVIRTRGTGVAAKLRRDHGCDRYLSTVTRSQKYVLDEGLFFARDHVLKYQEKVERHRHPAKHPAGYHRLLPPRNFGSATLRVLLDGGVTYPADRNELGGHAAKDAFVRGCSFPDYAEMEVWPRDSSGVAPVRYGFPALAELTVEAEADKMMAKVGGGPGSSVAVDVAEKPPARAVKRPTNPYVLDVRGLPDISEEIASKKRDCILFVSAPYCRTCKSLNPGYNRMARVARDELGDDLVFAKANTVGKAGKQLTFSLQVDAVPTFVLFRGGERYGTSLGVTRLPSKKLDLAIQYMKAGKEWDADVFRDDEADNKIRTKLK